MLNPLRHPDVLVHNYLINSKLYLDFINFPTNILFLFQDPIQGTTMHLFSCLPHLLRSMTVSQSVFVFMTLTVLRSNGQVLCRKSSTGAFLMFFLWLDWDHGFLEQISEKASTLLITPCQGSKVLFQIKKNWQYLHIRIFRWRFIIDL